MLSTVAMLFLHCHQQCTSDQNFPCLLLFVIFCVFLFYLFLITILLGIKWNFILTLIFIFLKANDAKHPFLHLLDICIASIEKCLLNSFVYFLSRLFFYYWVVRHSLYIVHTSTFQRYVLQKVSSILWIAFSFFMVSFEPQTL